MRRKNLVFASGGTLDPSLTDSNFTQGMVAGTVAKAEDVNTYGNKSDAQLKVVSDEICAAIEDQGIALNDNSNNQLSTMIKTKLSSGTCLTGITYNANSVAPSLVEGTLSFPAFSAKFNQDVFYGTTQSRITNINYSASTLTAGGAQNGVYYVYCTSNGVVTSSQSSVNASEGATKCLLGSYFVVNGVIQEGSWAYTPWLQQSSMATRTAPTAQTKGGLVTVASANTLAIGNLQLNAEGINYSSNKFDPNIKTISGTSPMSYKFLYIGYNPASSALTTLDTTHVYNMTAGTWDDVSGKTGFIVMVPCVAPTGQTLMIPAMSTVSGTTYASIFSTQKEAENAVFGLQYSLGHVADRVIYLGQSIIVKIGATDLTDPEQCEIYGVVPQSLAGFSNQGGQSGGGTGGFVPMNEVTHTGTAVTLVNQASNIVTASSSNTVVITFPTPTNNILNQLEVKFTPNASQVPGISFPNTVKWINGDAPSVSAGSSFVFIFEYNRLLSAWAGGYFSFVV